MKFFDFLKILQNLRKENKVLRGYLKNTLQQIHQLQNNNSELRVNLQQLQKENDELKQQIQDMESENQEPNYTMHINVPKNPKIDLREYNSSDEEEDKNKGGRGFL